MEPDKEKSLTDKDDNGNQKDEKKPEINLDTTNPPEIVEEPKADEAADASAKEGGEEADHDQQNEDQYEIELVPDLGKVSEEIDQFISALSSSSSSLNRSKDGAEDHSSEPPKIPEFLDQYAFLVEAKIANYDSADAPVKWSQLSEEESVSLLENVDRLLKLSNSLYMYSSESEYASTINRIGGILQRALSFFEEEFRLILEDYTFIDPDQESKAKQSSSSTPSAAVAADQSTEADQTATEPDPESAETENYFPGYSDEIVSVLSRLVNALIKSGHETECFQVYFFERRRALEATLQKLGFEKCSIDDIQKKNWDSLERDILTWIKISKEFSNTLLPSERNLVEAIFAGHDSISVVLTGLLSKGVMIQLLNFSEAVSMTKRSAEKLFKFLDVYETLRDLIPKLDGFFHGDGVNDLKTEASLTRCRLGESIICIFCELENSIKADTGKTPVPGGAVHPLTRYTMNYLKVACEYKDTLEQIFKEHQKIERADSVNKPEFDESSNSSQSQNKDNDEILLSPFQTQLLKVMDLLDANLEGKSKLYKDVSLSLIFLMNNGRYIMQKIKGSAEIKSLLGDSWCRKRSSDLRSYHKNYQRETWGKLLQYLSHEGLTVNGKVTKPVLKEKFKSFNAMFDEIHKTQSTWVVSDEQLQSELRVSISAVVIPAYRSFMARFSSTFTPGRQTEKYIKYQPEDIETHIEELFDGSSASALGKRRT